MIKKRGRVKIEACHPPFGPSGCVIGIKTSILLISVHVFFVRLICRQDDTKTSERTSAKRDGSYKPGQFQNSFRRTRC